MTARRQNPDDPRFWDSKRWGPIGDYEYLDAGGVAFVKWHTGKRLIPGIPTIGGGLWVKRP